MIDSPLIKYRVNRTASYVDRYVTAHTVLFERHHIVFIEASGQVLASFRAEDVISVIRAENSTVTEV